MLSSNVYNGATTMKSLLRFVYGLDLYNIKKKTLEIFMNIIM